MVTGIQELLLIALIITALILLPRLTARGKSEAGLKTAQRLQLPSFTGRQRLAIVVSLIWPIIVTLYLSPWTNGWRQFVIVGLGPIVLGWSIVWVITGFKGHRKKRRYDDP